MKKLSKDELLGELDHLFRCAHDGYGIEDEEFECRIEDCPKIYLQLREMIRDYDMVQEYLDGMKPTVDEAFVEKWTDKLRDRQVGEIVFSAELEEMLAEAGVEIGDKK